MTAKRDGRSCFMRLALGKNMAKLKVNHGVVSPLGQGASFPATATSCAAEAAQPSSESASKDDLEVRARAGVPLSRSAELTALAHKVASRRHLQDVEFSDAWVEKLAGDLAKFND
jgi:hypothetical protein